MLAQQSAILPADRGRLDEVFAIENLCRPTLDTLYYQGSAVIGADCVESSGSRQGLTDKVVRDWVKLDNASKHCIDERIDLITIAFRSRENPTWRLSLPPGVDPW